MEDNISIDVIYIEGKSVDVFYSLKLLKKYIFDLKLNVRCSS